MKLRDKLLLACFAGYVGLQASQLPKPSLDSDKTNVPNKTEQYITYDKVKPNYNYFGVSPSDSVVKKYKEVLENVPDNIQEKLNEKGVTINFFMDKITEHEKLIQLMYLKDEATLKNKEYKKFFFDSITNNIFIGIDWFEEYAALHDYAHAIDINLSDIVGEKHRVSDSKEMQEIFEKYRDKVEPSSESSFELYPEIVKEMKNKSWEFFAQFLCYYYSSNPKQRNEIEENFPEFATFMNSFEEKILLED